MKTRPFLTATLVSVALQSLYYMVIGGITFFIFPRMMESMLQDIPASGNPPPGMFNFMTVSFLMTGIGVILAPIVYIGTGALYAWLHRREEQPVTAEQGAIGGAVSAFTARFTAGILIAIGSLLMTNLMMTTMTDIFSPSGVGMPPGMPPMFSVFSNVTSVVGSLFGACFGSVIAAMLGGLGGSLTSAILK